MGDKDKRWLTFEELVAAPVQVSLINEPIEPERPKLRLVVNNDRLKGKEPNQ
jgi:hypothetical protein